MTATTPPCVPCGNEPAAAGPGTGSRAARPRRRGGRLPSAPSGAGTRRSPDGRDPRRGAVSAGPSPHPRRVGGPRHRPSGRHRLPDRRAEGAPPDPHRRVRAAADGRLGRARGPGPGQEGAAWAVLPITTYVNPTAAHHHVMWLRPTAELLASDRARGG